MVFLSFQPARYTKVEKADILEMTVRFLTAKPKAPKTERPFNSGSHYKIGYKACMEDLQKVLIANEQMLPCGTRDRLLQHLQSTAKSVVADTEKFLKDSNCNSVSDNTITIQGGPQKGKLEVRANNTETQCTTLYIPPSNTWSPPVVQTSRLESMCSPPSSPESLRTISPSGASSADLTCTVLQPYNFNTGARVTTNPRFADNLNQQQSFNGATFQYDTFSPASNHSLDFSSQSENKVLVQQFENLQPFQSPSPCYSESPFLASQPQSPTSCSLRCHSPEEVEEPQSVPLDLAAPKEETKISKEEGDRLFAHLPPSKRYHRRFVYEHSMSDNFQEDSHWRPW